MPFLVALFYFYRRYVHDETLPDGFQLYVGLGYILFNVVLVFVYVRERELLDELPVESTGKLRQARVDKIQELSVMFEFLSGALLSSVLRPYMGLKPRWDNVIIVASHVAFWGFWGRMRQLWAPGIEINPVVQRLFFMLTFSFGVASFIWCMWRSKSDAIQSLQRAIAFPVMFAILVYAIVVRDPHDPDKHIVKTKTIDIAPYLWTGEIPKRWYDNRTPDGRVEYPGDDGGPDDPSETPTKWELVEQMPITVFFDFLNDQQAQKARDLRRGRRQLRKNRRLAPVTEAVEAARKAAEQDAAQAKLDYQSYAERNKKLARLEDELPVGVLRFEATPELRRFHYRGFDLTLKESSVLLDAAIESLERAIRERAFEN